MIHHVSSNLFSRQFDLGMFKQTLRGRRLAAQANLLPSFSSMEKVKKQVFVLSGGKAEELRDLAEMTVNTNSGDISLKSTP